MEFEKYMNNLKIYASNIEQEAIQQVNTLMEQKSFCNEKVRIMPDVHSGKGCVIGFTSTMSDYIIPNVVGVDIGCGMLTIELGNIEIDFKKLDEVINKYIPNGRNVHEGRIVKFDKIQELKCFRNLKDTKRLERSIGTLGGGNHFIEVDIDNDGNKYLIIHTGSRNLGKQVAEYYQNLAYELLSGKNKLLEEQEKMIKEYKEQGRNAELSQAIKELYKKYKLNDCDIPKDLAYLTGKYKEEYLHDMKICQEYASLNREIIAKQILVNYFNIEEPERNFRIKLPGYIYTADCKKYDLKGFETIHNYIDLKSNIVRKGAISAKKGERLLIPINMRDGCIIGVGKGNEDWNMSAPHGAGRVLSRTKAKEKFNMQEYKDSMKDIYTTSVNENTLDELPMAYKPIEDILNCINDTIEIEKIIKPIYNFKASE